MDIKDIYKKQIDFQNSIKDKYDFELNELPTDNVNGFSYHIQHLISEIGEVLTADKRWKSLRKSYFNINEKEDEIADCFIVLMNIAIFSGIEPEKFEKIIIDKINRNFVR